MKKRLLTIFCVLCLVCALLPTALGAEDGQAAATQGTSTVQIDGTPIQFNTCVLQDELGNPVNFVKLRDVAHLLNGSAAQFNVDWKDGAILVTTGVPYTTPNGAELVVPATAAVPTATTPTDLLINGVSTSLQAFLLVDENGGGHTYFSLPDLGRALGFSVA